MPGRLPGGAQHGGEDLEGLRGESGALARGGPGGAGRGDDDADGPAQGGVFGVQQGDVDDDAAVSGALGGGAGVAGEVEADGVVAGSEGFESFVPATGAGADSDDALAVALAGAQEPAARPGRGHRVELGEDVRGDFGAEVEREVGEADGAGALLEPVDADDVTVPGGEAAAGSALVVVGQEVHEAFGRGTEGGDTDGFGDALGGLSLRHELLPSDRPIQRPRGVRSVADRVPLPTDDTTILTTHHQWPGGAPPSHGIRPGGQAASARASRRR